MPPVIQIENLSKMYRLGQVTSRTLRDDLIRTWARLRGKEDPFAKVGQVNKRAEAAGASGDYVWALRDINLEVDEGEILGIVGRNGAGKSTLLKLLSRVTSPTTGCIRIRGRIASLLEVGTGFHPDLTGRENVYMNGALLGMTRREISRRLDEIVEFSGCAKYIDTPVKRYSSGMTVRLGFAVAAHLQCEILIVDEVLAVGDAEFQRRCLGKIKEVTQCGRTAILVTHTMGTVSKLCSRAIWLDFGQIHMSAEAPEVTTAYLSHAMRAGSEWADASDTPGPIALRRVRTTVNDAPCSTVAFDQSLCITIDYDIKGDARGVVISMQITNDQGDIVLASWDTDAPEWFGRPRPVGTWYSMCHLPSRLLRPGSYSVTVYAHTEHADSEALSISHAVTFNVSTISFPFKTNRSGTVTPLLPWTIGTRSSHNQHF